MGVGVQGRLLQARRMQGCERRVGWGEVRERQKKQKDDMTRHVGRREKRQSVDPGREWLIMHMQRLATPHINQYPFLPTPHQQLKQILVCNVYVKSENKHTSKHLHAWTVKYSQEIQRKLCWASWFVFFPIKTKHKCCFTVSCFTFFSNRLVSLYWSGCCHVSEVVSAHMCSSHGWQKAGNWSVLPWMVVAVPGQTCQLGWHQCNDSWFGTRSDRQCC